LRGALAIAFQPTTEESALRALSCHWRETAPYGWNECGKGDGDGGVPHLFRCL
jgi:hypothetical protein